MKKKILLVIFILSLMILVTYLIISENNKGITLSIKNKTHTTINNISIYLYNSKDNINIYTLDNLEYSNIKHNSINIKKYPKKDYSLKIDFVVSGKKSENIIAYLPSINGKYKLDVEIKNLNKNLIANIKYQDSFQEIIDNIIIK